LAEKKHVFDSPRNVRRALWVLTALCVASFLADFAYLRHAVHPWEGVYGFYALFGFVACVVLVLVAKNLRKLLMRKETFYEDHD
jgi:hypothetical protein